MIIGRIAGSGRPKFNAAAVMTLTVAMTLAAGTTGAQAAASGAARTLGLAGQAGRAPAAAGTITTIAGGVGGPGLAAKVSVALPRGVSFAAGHMYISQAQVRAVSLATGQLTTPAGITC